MIKQCEDIWCVYLDPHYDEKNVRTYVTCSHKMIDKSHFGTIEIFIYSERRENADYRGEKNDGGECKNKEVMAS